MSRSNPLVTDAIEMQQRTLETSKQALEQAVEFPLRQSVEIQRNAATLFLNGLEMSNWAQNCGMEITRGAFSSYFDAVETVAGQTADVTEQRIEGAVGQQRSQPSQRMGPGDETQPSAIDQFQPTQKATWNAVEQPPQRANAGQQTGPTPTLPATGQQSTPGQAPTPTQPPRQPQQPPAGSVTPSQPARQAPPMDSPPQSSQQSPQSAGSTQQPTQSPQQPPQSTQQPTQPRRPTQAQQLTRSIGQPTQPAQPPAQSPPFTPQTPPVAGAAGATNQLPGTWSDGRVPWSDRGPSRSEPTPPTDEGSPATGSTRAESESNATEAAAENA